MKVALLGAPGSGKSDVARRIARNLNRDKTGQPWTVVDEYVDELTKLTGFEYGVEADYPLNVQIMAARWTKEATAGFQNQNTVTCGTIYETIIYAYLKVIPMVRTESAMIWTQGYTDVCMRFFGAMEDVTTRYDVMFYLPLENPEHSWDAAVDAKLPEILEAEGHQAYVLQGTVRQKVTDALTKIRPIRDTYIEASSFTKDVG